MVQAGSIRVELMAGIGFLRLSLAGPLTAVSSPPLRRTLTAVLLEHGRVVVDVSGLRVLDRSCLSVFGAAYERAGGWPQVRMVLSGPPEGAVAEMRGTGWDRYVLVCEDIVAAVDGLDRRPPRVRRSRPLDIGPVTPSQARTLVAGTCRDWRVPHAVAAKGLLLINELAVSAVARQPRYLRAIVELDDDILQLRMREWPGAEPDALGPLTQTALAILSDGWSTAPRRDSMVVSAAVQMPT